MYSEEEARERGMALRDATEGEPCAIEMSEEKMGMVPEDERYDLHLLTGSYELTPGIVQALHRNGPYGVRHLGQVRENDPRHVWLLTPQ